MTVRIRVIPCLDVADGRVVKGVKFVDLKDAGDPVEQAKAYDEAGADELCFLDISASHEGRRTLLDVVQKTAEVCFMPLTVGGVLRALMTLELFYSRALIKLQLIAPLFLDQSLYLKLPNNLVVSVLWKRGRKAGDFRRTDWSKTVGSL